MQRQLLSGPLLARSVLTSLAAAPQLLAASAARADVRYEWDAVPGASYYEGSAHHDQDESFFRTKDRWLMLPEHTKIDVHAVSGGDDGPLPVRHLPVRVGSAQPPSLPQPQAAPGQRSYVPDDAAAAADDQVLADVLEPADGGKVAAPAAQSRPTRWVILSVGAGREWLKASGGTSQFAAAPGIGATLLHGQWQPPKASWYLDLAGEAHNFQAATTLETPSGKQVGNASAKFLRAAARGAVFYDFNGAGSGREARLSAGIGVSYERMPMLLIAKSGTTAATLQDQHGVGPYFAVNGEVQSSVSNRFGGTLGLLPTAFSNSLKSLSLNVSSYYRRSFTAAFFGELGADFRRTFLSQHADCPALDSCHDISTANSNLFLLDVGIGLNI